MPLSYITGHSDHTILQKIENDPDLINNKARSKEANSYMLVTTNEICNLREKFLREIHEAKSHGYDITWLANDTTEITSDLGISYNHFEYQAGAYHHHGLVKESPNWSRLLTGLFLPGKSNKMQRLGPIKYLHESGLLNDMVYSLKLLRNSSLQYFLDELNTNEEFFLALEKDLDFSLELITNHDNQHYTGYPYDSELYSKTGWSLISESSMGFKIMNSINPGCHHTFQDKPWITEKTYRTIYNNHPFILLGEYGCHNFLNQMGYQTFEKFYGVELDNFWPNANDHNIHTECQELVRVVKRFKENLQIHQEEIAEMVEYNKQNLINRYNDTKTMFDKMNHNVIFENTNKSMPLSDYAWFASYRNNVQSISLLPDYYKYFDDHWS